MTESSDDLCSNIQLVAKNAVQSYAQGLVSLEILSQQIQQEWEARRVGDDQPPLNVLKRIAQRLCSQVLWSATHSPDDQIRNRAFENIRRHLDRLLVCSSYVRQLQYSIHTLDDVVNQTLEIIHTQLIRDTNAGPREPAAFLGWMKTILIHKAQEFVEKSERDPRLSLDEHAELFGEQIVDITNVDPADTVMHDEFHQKLLDILLSIRNANYGRVLIYEHIVGLSDAEIADRLHVPLARVYVWRSRALSTFRNNPEIMEALRYLRE